MDFMFDWDNDGDRFSFEDSDRFEEDSLCSWISEPESLCNNWRGWKRQNGGGQISSSVIIKHQDGPVPQLVELASKAVARHIPFEVVEHFGQPIPEQLQLYIAFWSFPENEEDIRLYSCLANGSADEFQKGEHLYKVKAVKDALQIGFHLSATVVPPQGLPQVKGSFNVAVVFDRRRISSCTCTCKSQPSWCSHIVALCLYRIHQASSVCLRAPVSESLSRLQRDQLQKFAQYLISELPQQILPTAQRLLDELLSSQESAMNTVCGAPDPTAGPSASEQTSWCLDESTLHENVKKTLVKFCIPSPIVFSDVNYLSATAPPAAAEWQSLLRPLRGREPEGMWNLLSIVREMFRRNDSNAIPLLEIITDEVLQCEQILIWWFTTKATSNNNNNICRGNSSSGANATQHAAASLCDEIVTLWRLAALNPKLSPIQRDDLCLKFKEWHISTVEKVRKARTSGSSTGVKKNDIENFIGFKPAIEACHLKWDDYPIPGVTYSEKEGSCFRYRFNKNHDKDKKPSRIQPVTVCSESIISTDNKTTLAQAQSMLQDHHHNVKDMTIYRHHNSSSPQDSMGNDGAISSGSEGFCEPERNSSLFRDSDSGSEMKDINSRSNSLDDQDMGNYASNMIRHGNLQLGINNVNYLSSASKGEIEVFDSPEVLQDEGNTYDMEPRERNAMEEASGYMKAENSSESQHSGDEYQIYFYSNSKAVDSEKKKENTEEPNFFGGVKSVDNMQDVLFARAEALHAHGHTREACRLAQRLAEELLTNPPDLLAESANLPSLKGKKKKALTNISLLASCTLSKAAFLCSVLAEEPESCHLAFKVGMFGLELPRPPASCKALEVKLAYQETEILNLLKRIPLGAAELAVLRDKAEELRDGTFKSRGEALLPLTLATVIFDSLCLPVFPVGSTNSRPPSRSVQVTARTPADERLGFDGAVAALGLKANVSEAEHPLLCESTRRQRGELAIAMLVHYKDDPFKLSRIMDKLLDKEVHQLYKAPSLVNYLGGNKPSNTVVSVSSHSNSPAHPVASRSSMDGATAEERPNNRHPVDPVVCSASRTVTRENTSLSSQNRSCSSGARPKITYPLRYNSGKDTDSSAVEEEDELRVLEAKLKCMAIKKKPSQGMASIDSSAPETTSSDNSPTLVRHIWNKPQGPGSDCGSSADSDSLGSSSSGEKDARAKLRDNDSPPSPLPAPLLRSQQLIMESRSSTPNVKNTRYKGKSRIMPTVPNQPSEALAHFMFELSKNVLAKAGGNSSTSLFTQPSNTNTSTGPHRNLHLCAFQIGLYALGLNNCVSPNWLSRTYSSHVSWITGQATDIGSTAINILIDTWEGHLTPPEVASLADKASRGRDPALVKAAADLALSCLPLAQALNPAEVQRALFQCKEQSREMLERACLAVESAAKGGGVYPEVLFDVARQWFELSEEAAKSSHLSDTSHHNSSLKELESDSLNSSFVSAERQSPSTLQVIPISSTPPLSHACSQIPISNQVLSHTNNPLPAQPMVLSYAIPQSGHHPQLPHQTLVQHIGYVQQIPPFGQQYTPQHIPLHSHNIHPYVTFPYQTQPPFSNLQGIPTPANLYPATQFRPLGTAVQVYPNHNHCQMTSVNGTPVSSAAGPSSHPVELPIEGASNSPSPPHQAVHQGQQNGGHIHNQTQMNYLMTAFRVGMLAMETLARRVHDDRPQTKYARNPPHGEDVKWLLGIAVKLGLNHLQQFCASAVNAVVSPFILYDIAVEAAHVLARNNPAVVQSHLRSNILNPLVQKCLQMFTQCAHQRIHHINQSEYDDFVSTVCSARNAFCLTPGGMVQFQELLQSLRRSKSCRKDLWTRIVHGLATGNV